MAQKKKKAEVNRPVQPVPVQATPEQIHQPVSEQGWFTFRNQVVILFMVGLLFYGNTFPATWAYDDSLVILSNDHVQEGLAGIPAILTVDAFESYTRSQNETTNQLTGGRYRPLSIITFAVEQQLLGLPKRDTGAVTQSEAYERAKAAKTDRDMHVRHVVNVLLYIFSVAVLLLLFRKTLFKTQPMAAFAAAFIFLVHPIHSEVVANVKSRDEILSLLFIALTFLEAFRYREQKSKQHLWLACLYLFLALLSKEYAIMLLLLLPAAFYFFYNERPANAVNASLIYLLPVGLYGALRLKSVGVGSVAIEDIMNIPYLYATPMEAFATKIAVLFDYIRLQIVPYPLISDYTYNQVPYVELGNYRVILSLLLNGFLVWLMVMLTRKRHPAGFLLIWYFAFELLISNFFINIGSVMGERLIYHSSVAFIAGIVMLIWMGLEKVGATSQRSMAMVAVLAIVAIPSALIVLPRNLEWRANKVLFVADAKRATNSVIINANAGRAYMELSDEEKEKSKQDALIRKAITQLNRALEINPRYIAAYVNRSLCYMRFNLLDSALADCDTINKYFPTHPSLPYISQPLGNYFSSQGLMMANQGKMQEALENFRKAADAAPQNVDYQYNYAFSLCKANRLQEGKAVCAKALAINPNHAASRQLMSQLNGVPGLK